MTKKIEETINGILKKHKLAIKKIYRLGPRFFAALAARGKEKFFFKTAIFSERAGGLEESFEISSKKIKTEALFLNFLKKCPKFRFKNSIPEVVDFGGNPKWYIWKLVEGEKQNVSGGAFLFKKDFFTEKNAEFVTDFFSNLRECSDFLPASLKKQFVKRRPNLKSYENAINLPVLIERNGLSALKNKISKKLDENRKIYDDSVKFLTHYEPYAPHFFRQKSGEFVVIDWENVGFGNPIHDLSIIWIRAYNNFRWRKKLLSLAFQGLNYEKEKAKKIFETEVIIQSIANLDYFSAVSRGKEAAEKRDIIGQMKRFLKLAVSGNLIKHYFY